ncbi:ABC transporter permease [Leucobacter chinensis]|uniref:ABC transporter permease n=1 Tax=Leucobacter chinensis TaxID=2851010 RepID=UPI001C233E57|nr:ABC transporter permease [Leucobacter chinensis]
MNRLTRSLSAEWRKVTATKLWWILALVMLIYAGIMGGVFAGMFAFADNLDTGGAGLGMSPEQMGKLVLSSVSGFCYVIPLLLGAIMATGELRHKILGLSFIAEPKRGIVLTGKVIVLLVVGALLGAAGLIGAGVMAAILLPAGWLTTATALLGLRTLVAIGLWAVIGFGVGLLVRNQAVTIVLMLVFTQFIEPTVRATSMMWEWMASVVKFLPGSASDGFVGASILGGMGVFDSSMSGAPSSVLEVAPAFFVLVAYAVVSVLAGWALRWRGDVA